MKREARHMPHPELAIWVSVFRHYPLTRTLNHQLNDVVAFLSSDLSHLPFLFVANQQIVSEAFFIHQGQLVQARTRIPWW